MNLPSARSRLTPAQHRELTERERPTPRRRIKLVTRKGVAVLSCGHSLALGNGARAAWDSGGLPADLPCFVCAR